jgi:uncharacterized Zn-finger protein
MAVGSEPEETYHKVLTPIQSMMATSKETKEENLEEMVKEENVIFLMSDKEIRKEESQMRKIHSCPYEYCERSFSRPWRLASHIRSHTGQVSFFCCLCCHYTDLH